MAMLKSNIERRYVDMLPVHDWWTNEFLPGVFSINFPFYPPLPLFEKRLKSPPLTFFFITLYISYLSPLFIFFCFRHVAVRGAILELYGELLNCLAGLDRALPPNDF